MRLDHVSYAAGPAGLAAATQRLGSALGAGFSDGGMHPSFGTRNFVLPLAGGCYLEVVEVLDHPAADTASFGRAVRSRQQAGGGWVGWVIGVDDLQPIEARLSRPAVAGHRRRPDGRELRWRQLGVSELAAKPYLPYFVQWLVDPQDHPSSAARGAASITRLELAGSPDALAEHTGQEPDRLPDGPELAWVDAEQPGLVAVVFDTPNGRVRLD